MRKWAFVVGLSLFVAAAGAWAADTPSAKFDTPPDWLRKPTAKDFALSYPDEAAKTGLSGEARIRCWVKVDGQLRNCSLVSERPSGMGFGAQALFMARSFTMKPATTNGQPKEAEITIPITWRYAIAQVQSPAWISVPSEQDVIAAFPAETSEMTDHNIVSLTCSVLKRGTMQNCVATAQTAPILPFENAALSLIKKFKLDPSWTSKLQADADISFDIQIASRDSNVWKTHELGKIIWTRVPHLGAGQKSFPDEAAKAGLKTGSATVDCAIGTDGGLTKCATLSESAPGVGFGPLALNIAQGFAISPWTEEGLPAEGAHVRLPIKMVDDHADQAAPPTPATKP